ncbi:MAG: CesT family type III secretion system chaperone [Polyangiaceae bacterium]|nr:CesT family type III secretion system chaperone [Polyangiaceae bacterium]MCW5789160.1 CesT family type III secretion system chaperone [Polyangiaceae bacterium]
MTTELLEGYLNKLDRPFERSEDGTYVIIVHRQAIALRVAQPVLVIQTEIGPVEADVAVQARVFRRLLELNASDLMHAAYAIEEDRIVLCAALELANLDFNELEAVLADMDLALSKHVPGLRQMSQQEG